MPKLTFLGAAGTVTGSKYLVEAEGKRLLVDCGLFQGLKELRLRNWNPLPQKPDTFDWCVLTHAHLDHTGYLPRLVRDGFRGPIYADAATIELCGILLADSAHLQEEDADKAGRGGYSKHAVPLPLYGSEDVGPVVNALREIPRAGSFTISPQFTVRTQDAGHILGSASLELTITENGKKTVVLFSGDIGRYEQVILKNPVAPARCDVLLCESTYGDRDHPPGSQEDALADVINRAVNRGGQIVIPAFAVDRTQAIMYIVRKLEDSKRIPRLPVYVDSPMAITSRNYICATTKIMTRPSWRKRKPGIRSTHIPYTSCARSMTPRKLTMCARQPSSFPPAAWPPADASSITLPAWRRIPGTLSCWPGSRRRARAAGPSRKAPKRCAFTGRMFQWSQKSSICVNFPRTQDKVSFCAGSAACPRRLANVSHSWRAAGFRRAQG